MGGWRKAWDLGIPHSPTVVTYDAHHIQLYLMQIGADEIGLLIDLLQTMNDLSRMSDALDGIIALLLLFLSFPLSPYNTLCKPKTPVTTEKL